jgi:3-oxoacyl-[acyl-carrier protein] reductase
MGRFEGKSVIITGAASGFGAAIAVKFRLEGASVRCADLNLAGAQEVAAGLPYAQALEIDVFDEAANSAMIGAAVSHYGKVEVLCCNAGTSHRDSDMIKMDVEDCDRMWSVIVRSLFRAARAAIHHMLLGSGKISLASLAGKGLARPYPRPCV